MAFDIRQVWIQRQTEPILGGESDLHMTGKGQVRGWIQVRFLGLANIDEVDELLDRKFASVDTESC